MKEVLRGTFIALSDYIKKWRDLTSIHMNALDTQEQKHPEKSKQKEMTKLVTEINIDKKKNKNKFLKSGFFKNSKIDKTVVKLTKRKEEDKN